MDAQLTIVMISMHTSPLAQPGQGDAGGLNVYIRNLAYALIEAGHQVLCFTRRTEADDHTVILDEYTDSKVIPLAVGRLSLPKEALADLTTEFACALVSTVPHHAKHKIVLHSHYWLSGMVAYHAGLALHAPAIHTMHTLGATKNKSAPGTEPAYRIECENFICAHAQVITANTVIEKQELVQHTGVHPDRVTVIHPGVDHRVFRPYGPARWPGRVRDGSPKVLFAGRLQYYKGPHVLLQALAILRDRGAAVLPLLHFTGAVSGDSAYDLRAQAYLLGIHEQVSFSAPVSPDTLAEYMRAADVVAMPSISESFGFVAVEAQACGTPVIAHGVGGLTVAVADGTTGRLIDTLDAEAWADVLDSLAYDSQRWREYGAAGVNHAAQFSWSAMAKRMVSLYKLALLKKT